MIDIKKDEKIYILCPANFATGGPEALHQLGSQLRQNGMDAEMYYVNYDWEKFSSPVHPEYERYRVPFVLQVENDKKNWLIFPETFTVHLWDKDYSELRKIIWWLSVTNYFISLDLQREHLSKKKFFGLKQTLGLLPIPSIRRLRRTSVLHIAHSYFSINFLEKSKLKIAGQISDYMKETFLTGENYQGQKQDYVAYNVIKNRGFLEEVIKNSPEINWMPIENMSNHEVIDVLQKSKVYVDFGYHPGKERMPREACLMDCCMVIGKEGSAKFKEDMPIPDDYRFDKAEENIPHIIGKIKDCLENYPARIQDFYSYKKDLLKEKETFQAAVANVFRFRPFVDL